MADIPGRHRICGVAAVRSPALATTFSRNRSGLICRKKILLPRISRCVDANLLLALLVGELSIVFANVFQQRVVRNTAIAERDCPWLFERGGIFNRNFVA